MKVANKLIIGSLITASVVGVNYNISSADKLEQDTYITTNRLNMRKGPSTDYALVGTLNKGEKVIPIEKSSDGKWVKIKYNSQQVWVSFAYLQKVESQNNTDTNIKIGSEYETTANLNMRKGASTDFVKIATIPLGIKVMPNKVSNDGKWVQVKYNNQTGWISVDYIKIVNNVVPSEPNKVEVGKKYATTVNVNTRKGPSSDYEVVTVLKKGTVLEPVEVVKAGYWAKFKYNNEYIYVCTTYLELAKENQDPGDTTPDIPVKDLTGTYQTIDNLSLRMGAGTSYGRYCVIPNGTKIEASKITLDGEWIKVTYNKQSGWVKSEYVKKAESGNTGDTQTPSENVFYTTENLNFRLGASTTSSKIGQIPKNTKVTVTDFNSDKSWAKVKYDGRTGWVSAQYLTTKAPTVEQPTYWNGTTSENLNLRKGPSTSYAIMVQIPKNTKVKVYEENNGWLKVKYNSYEGYCSALYIK